jgi:biopolymer transport protein ExbD
MSHRHKKPSGGAGGVQLGLIITPMLDMAFQILAFFIMTYHPSALEGHIPGSLVPPENFAKKGKDNAPANPLETPLSVSEDELVPELNEAITIKIKAIARGQEVGNKLEGHPSQVFYKQSTDTSFQMLTDVDVDFDRSIKILDSKLRELLKKGASKTNVKIDGDSDLRQQFVMRVYDTCKKVGFDKIHFVPPPVLNAKFK